MPNLSSLIVVIAATLYVMDRAASYANGKRPVVGGLVMFVGFALFLLTFQATLSLLS